MSKPPSFLRVLCERGPLLALSVAGLLLLGILSPAYAQFFGFGGPPRPPAAVPRGGGGGGGGGGWFGNDIFAPFQPQVPQKKAQVREDFSRAPAPDKRETPATRNVLVLGDAMADWLAYGLENAYAETPEMGVIRKHKTVSGLIRYQPKGDPADWAAAAKGILATENPDAIVVMLGLNDRMPIREGAEKPADKKADKGKKDEPAKADQAKPDQSKSDQAKSDQSKTDPSKPADPAAKPEERPSEADLADDADLAAPEKNTRSASGSYEFREDRWAELYGKKIAEMIAVLKTKGVPVLWVGLPAVRGTKSTSDAQYLNALYRDGAGKAGITYVDVWDGFVDEGGRYLQQGPDFEGQIRRLRSYDGVYFTKAGARKLAHYAEREIARLLAGRSAPIVVPSEPEAETKPDGPTPRPLVGPVVPLVAASISTDQLLGGPSNRSTPSDVLATRTLVKGEPLVPPPGRADDFAWPRREVGTEQARGEVPVVEVPAAASGNAAGAAAALAPAAAPKPKKPRPIVATPVPTQQPPAFGGFFGFQSAPTPPAPVAQQPQRPRVIRAPSLFGPSAELPGFFGR
ncbi:DUF459 domain-containing protein [Rhodopseudomonas pseudopalustris]|uniref:SGNH/GDSL hydrolase family protein n=1 Tax=Rhodopseudomonas pseudopalustris TaxID=1513892 RepID=UPI003F97EBA9